MGWPASVAIPPALAEAVAGYIELARQFDEFGGRPRVFAMPELYGQKY